MYLLNELEDAAKATLKPSLHGEEGEAPGWGGRGPENEALVPPGLTMGTHVDGPLAALRACRHTLTAPA